MLSPLSQVGVDAPPTPTIPEDDTTHHKSNALNTSIDQTVIVSNTTPVFPRASQHSSFAPSSSGKRLYRSNKKWVTREIAALDFLLGIPLQAEPELVHAGWLLQRQIEQEPDYRNTETEAAAVRGQRWWEKVVQQTETADQFVVDSLGQLERPTVAEKEAWTRMAPGSTASATTKASAIHPSHVPGRRLQGDNAVTVQIPLTTSTMTKQKTIARVAALREWELRTAHGLNSNTPPMLDGRLFFSAGRSYPINVFSIIRYEPKKEEAAIRRQKLEARGGGGSQFVIPTRDWRGISYRALLPRTLEKDNRAFNRFLRKSVNDLNDDSSTSSDSSEDSDVYVPGLLDDPEMTLGRHRKVWIGDKITGPIVASTIQFVEPALLKAELNKQFRERFEGWEPPKTARKYIGARVVSGNYVLVDPSDANDYEERSHEKRARQGSVASSISSASENVKEKLIRMPPSLTLSKIRSLKHQALMAALKAKLEIGTVALASVYFERLCLDCRVDKSNRRLAFAACLVLACKINEPNIGLVMKVDEDGENSMTARIQSLVRPNKRMNTMFASLLEFFTEEWSLSIKHLFDAEWGVFAALGFSLLANPSQVAFHFKRMLKTLEWSSVNYLGDEMYRQWQDALKDEEDRRKERERRRELQRKRKQQQLLNLHIEIENDLLRRHNKEGSNEALAVSAKNDEREQRKDKSVSPGNRAKKSAGMKLLHRLGMRRALSQERLNHMAHSEHVVQSEHLHVVHVAKPSDRKAEGLQSLTHSPSLPAIATAFSDNGIYAIDIPDDHDVKSDTSSIESVSGSDVEGIVI